MKKSSPLIVGNWKAFINSPKEGLALLKKIDIGLPRTMRSTIVACPPALLVAHVRDKYRGKRIALGVQDISLSARGPHTGEVTAELARSCGATYAIVGHAERRALGEDSSVIAREARAALDSRLTPIICVGEGARDREGHYYTTIETMLAESMRLVLPHELTRIVIAYEPVWAIGAAVAPDPRVVHESLLFIRKTLASLYGRDSALKVKIIYGGAVDADTARDLLVTGNAGGFLVGRASVDAHNFLGIIKACH